MQKRSLVLAASVVAGIALGVSPSSHADDATHFALPLSMAALGVAAPAASYPAASYTSSSTPSPLSPPPPFFPATAIDSVLLGPTEVIAVTGLTGTPLEVNSMTSYSYLNEANPASCSGVMLGAEHGSDPNAGLAAMRSQTLSRAPGSEGQGPTEVEQSVSVFSSGDEARAVVIAAESQWQLCAKNGVIQGSGEDIWHFDFGSVQFRGDMVTVSMAALNQESGNRACQTAIGLRANVVAEAWTCLWPNGYPVSTSNPDPSWAGRYAEHLVATMLDKVEH